jgi:hypothetical protein
MALFARKLNQTDDGDVLPDGYDDPGSPWFVPESLREHYRALPGENDPRRHHVRTVGTFVAGKGEELDAALTDLDPADQPWETDPLLAIHQERLAAAQRNKQGAEAAAQHAAASRLRLTCDACGQYDTATAEVINRHGHTLGKLCDGCLALVAVEQARRAAGDQLDDGRSRQAAVAAWLDLD